MEARTYVSISDRSYPRPGHWRVAVLLFDGNVNHLDRTLAERFVKSETAARRLAAEWAKAYNAEMLP